MIIKKSKFKYTKKGREAWPFNVPEVTVIVSTVENNGKPLGLFGIVHNFAVYALSGLLENYGIPPLVESGILVQENENYRNLQPFFDHVIEQHRKLSEKSE